MSNAIQTTPAPTPSNREALLRAAQAYDNLNGQILDLETKLGDATVALEGRNARIQVLERAMHEEREQFKLELLERENALATYREQVDEARWERNELRVVLLNLRTQLNAVEIPLRPALPKEEPAANGHGTDWAEYARIEQDLRERAQRASELRPPD